MMTQRLSTDSAYFVSKMQIWFVENGRDLPWRHHPTPYQVWVSELMLQQTQVITVLDYYKRWINRFPDVQSLAAASLDEVLSYWAGLGYYRRARYLLDGARFIVEKMDGVFPDNPEDLKKIPGIGEYTAGAMASFAFGQNVPAVDGNAERVLSRFFGIQGDLSKGESRQLLMQKAWDIARLGKSSVINQAIMDLGAGSCARKPKCEDCPIARQCYALRNGLTELLPQKKTRVEKTIEFRAAIKLVDKAGRLLIGQRKSDQLLGNLWEFPMVSLFKGKDKKSIPEGEDKIRLPRKKTWQLWIKRHSISVDILDYKQAQTRIMHIFTHIQMFVVLDEVIIEAGGTPEISDNDDYQRYCWVSEDDLKNYAMSGLMMKLL